MKDLSKEDYVRILRECRNIAVIGLSRDPYRASYGVAEYMVRAGYNIIPVNPKYKEVLGRKCYASLRDIPEPIDMVDVFRNPEHIVPIIEEAIAIGAKVVWLQLGVINEKAIEKAQAAGLEVVVDRCLKIEHGRYRSAFTSR